MPQNWLSIVAMTKHRLTRVKWSPWLCWTLAQSTLFLSLWLITASCMWLLPNLGESPIAMFQLHLNSLRLTLCAFAATGNAPMASGGRIWASSRRRVDSLLVMPCLRSRSLSTSRWNLFLRFRSPSVRFVQAFMCPCAGLLWGRICEARIPIQHHTNPALCSPPVPSCGIA